MSAHPDAPAGSRPRAGALRAATLWLLISRSLRQHALSTSITAAAAALASGLVMALFAIHGATPSAFSGGKFTYDAILGAPGSQEQLVLNTLFHLDASPGNIPWAMYRELAETAAAGRLADAARVFHGFVGTDRGLAALDADYYERCAPSMPALLRAGRDAAAYRGPVATDPEQLARVTVPVLLVRGEQTRLGTFYSDTVRHVADHVADPRVRPPLSGLGHCGPLVEPEPVAAELLAFADAVVR